MFPKVLLQWCAALSSCAAEIERRRQGKFQPFRRLFGKRKKRQAAARKASFSSEEVCNRVLSDDEETNQHLRELLPIGSRSFSHDSVFIPEEPVHEPSPERTMSQENVSDKVRNLQRQIAQNIKFGQRPPSLRKSEGEEGSSDEEEVARSPLKVLAQVEAEPVDTEPQEASQDQGASLGAPQTPSTPLRSPRSKRVIPATGTIESIDLDGVPQPIARLDNTAAKHKLSVKPKNQRISRKHRRFTQDLQEVDIPGILQEQTEAAEETAPEKTKKQKLQEEQRLESQRKEELAEHSRREEEDRRRKAEEWRLRELEEERCRKLEEERILKEEEDRGWREAVEKRRKEEEEKRIKDEEESRIREEEERRLREEEERRLREEEEKRLREEEVKRLREEEEKRLREEEERRMREELEYMQREEEYRMLEEERRNKEEEERKQQELETERIHAEEKRLKEAEEEEEMKKRQLEENRKLFEEEEEKRLSAEVAASSSDSDKKRRAEEVRWREMEERQRPFTFKVSSGEKQILFQKVNLTPVTPASSQQVGAVAEHRQGAKTTSPGGADSPTLPSSQYVPHTAILVTGAQLCGTAVNLDHIKETACKSLLGLADEKKAALGTPPPTMTKSSPDRKSGKTKSLSESTDQSSAAVLAEWASIRSKIFKGAEEGKYEDYPDPQSQTRPSSEDQSPFPHTNLRKTMSASAKFSITPARKKFADSNRNSEVFSPEEKEGGRPASVVSDTSVPPAASPGPGSKAQSRGIKTVRIADGTGECMFAKDLPSFIVPSSCQGSPRPQSSETDAGSPGGESEDSDGREEGEKGQPSPFGIKLRRTNYSLRFHSDQSADKRKKRYSAGDSFDGVPSPLTPIDPDSDASVFSDKSSPASPLREGIPGIKPGHVVASLPEPRSKAGRSPTTSMHSEGEKLPSKASLYQRPSTSPKPVTPPPSPVPKVGRGGPIDAVVQRTGVGEDPAGYEESGERRHDTSAVAQLHRNSQGEEEPKERRSFFPSISIPWREKADRKTELIRRDGKPSLQSRHSLDSARVQDKETGPLWITLALQKQKGFREQQQSRDERRSHREAKLTEKLAKDKDGGVLVCPLDGKGSGNISPPKPQTPEESKRPDTLLCRLERRDQLKKANTLPSSVTVEIADSTPSPPTVKEVTKRFPSSDSPQVSTEPAWLALAKRKAKAWSDCPQIIK
ncbi:cancer-related regulator of actin dynamics homolog isoform X3 [Esox lucius]|uniref:cancer-related regulator of actin dynamics homolog isoform X3 n=1 Tax=Esox lucius TaxID=8010 RepID=UPI0014774F27|nr:cancer-related regulator of actin dynamics homolog isoform X3 [Esox lucius]